MHFVLSWDIKAQGAKRKEINDAMKQSLSGYSWVRPLTTFYIVKVNSQTDWDSLHSSLTAIAKKYTKEIRYVIGPPISGGGYAGWLPKDLWPKIRERAE